jgi:hypothetical protein
MSATWSVRTVTALCGLLAVVLVVPAAQAQRTHLLVISGLSGEPQYAAQFRDATRTLVTTAKARWGVGDSSLIVLAEDPAAEPGRGRARSTREEVAQAFLTLSRRVAPGDVVLVLLLGHGSGEGPGSRVNLPGPDPTAADYAGWIAGFPRQQVVFVNAASASGDFVPVLAAPGRVVVTATKSALQRNETVFATHFVKGLTSDEADADKDGRVSVLEAFRYATREVERAYSSTNRLQTEHARISDSTLAARVAFGGAAASTDPRIAALVAERQQLESEVAALRNRKDTMDAAAYEQELERLLLAIAEKTRAIRAAGGRE